MLHALIMAGGAGTRFWPASRAARPKQLLDLAGERSMIRTTVDRLGDLVPPERALVLTNQSLVKAMGEQLPDLPSESILGEPCKRDTAPCVALAAAVLSHRDPQAIMVVMPSDHVIQPEESFRAAIAHAAQLVAEDPGRIVTFGIKPTYAAESFGYIERGDQVATDQDSPPTFQVSRFREKPQAEVAQRYLDAGSFYWNSGIFVWSARTVLDALRSFEPEMYQHIETIGKAIGSDDFPQVLERQFAAIDGKSIDYAVMERYDNVVVVEAPFEWDDVGSWTATARLRGTDKDGNTVAAKHIGINTRGSIVRGESDHLIVTVGMEDCIVVHTSDATLVANKSDEESIRQVVDLLKQREWNEYL